MIPYLIIILALIGLIAYREWQSVKEREDWGRKLMAKSYYDYMLTPKAPSPRTIDKQIRTEVNQARQTAETMVPLEDMGTDQVDKLLHQPKT